MRYSAQEAALRTGQVRRELGPGKAQHEETTRGAVRGLQGFGQGHKGGFAVTEHNLTPPLGDEMGTSRVHYHADIISGIGTHARPPIARALQPA